MFLFFKIIMNIILLSVSSINLINSFTCSRMCTTRSRKLNLEMNLVNRFFKVVTSNLNNVINNLEDPEKLLEQSVNDMQGDLVKIRQSYAEISATQKRSIKQKEQADKLADDWYKRAQLALDKGDEELAREALSRRQIQVELSESTDKNIQLQAAAIDKLYVSMTSLQDKIEDAKRQKDIMIARARTAKTSVQVNDMLNSVGGSSSMDAFERMKAKVESLEAKAEVAGELAASVTGSSVSLNDRFKELESGSKVNDELEMMKRRLPGKQKEAIAELPATLNIDPIDDEYEKLKKELGR